LWLASRGEPVGEPLLHTARVRTVAFSPDGQTLATASSDRTAKLWAVKRGERPELKATLAHRGPVLTLAFSGDGQALATGAAVQEIRPRDGELQGGSGEVRIWHASGKPLLS